MPLLDGINAVAVRLKAAIDIKQPGRPALLDAERNGLERDVDTFTREGPVPLKLSMPRRKVIRPMGCNICTATAPSP